MLGPWGTVYTYTSLVVCTELESGQTGTLVASRCVHTSLGTEVLASRTLVNVYNKKHIVLYNAQTELSGSVLYIFIQAKKDVQMVPKKSKRTKIKLYMGNILAKFNHVEIPWINLKVFADFEFTY